MTHPLRINGNAVRQFAVRPGLYATDRERWAQFPWGAYDLKPILYGLENRGGVVAATLAVPDAEKGSLWFTNITALHTQLTVFVEHEILITAYDDDEETDIGHDGFFEAQVLDVLFQATNNSGQLVTVVLENWRLVCETQSPTQWFKSPECPVGNDDPWGDPFIEENNPQPAQPSFRQRIPRPERRS